MTTISTSPVALTPTGPASPAPQSPPEPVPATPGAPRWARPAFYVLLLATGALYLWGLGASGWANSFYSAAAQAGSASWKAFFFGSSDAANSITVDKTPLALWPMALSVKVFGLSSWSILVPQALEGVATVALLHRLVRRTTGSAGAALIAGAVLALTPVAVLMFRFNNPDAMLALLLVGASGATLRAVEESARPTGRPLRWVSLGGALVGLAFLTKMLQAFLVLPGLALVYLLFAKTPLGRRLVHLIAAFGAMLLAGGWWVAIVQFWPAASRPYIGGSQHNSILELTLGYNGFGRLSGNETGSVGGGAGGRVGGWGATGIGRLFGAEIGGQIAWLLPAALLLGAASFWFARHRADGSRLRAAVTLWAVTLLVTGLTFSFMAGIFHAYYTVALAPSIAALVAIGSWLLWRERGELAARVVLAATAVGTSTWAFVLLDRSPNFLPWLRFVAVGLGIAAALGILVLDRLRGRWIGAVAAVALAGSLVGPAAYAVDTASTPHTGSIPSAGPNVPGARGGMPGGGPGGFPGRGGFPGGAPPTGAPPAGAFGNGAPTGAVPGGRLGGPGGTGFGRPGGTQAGGLLTGSTSSAAITALLKADAGRYTWVAAAVGSNTAAGYQLASQLPVMAIGGFNGSDPSPTLAEFQADVAAGEVHYFIAGGNGGPGGPGGATGSTSSSIAAWVTAHFTAKTVDGITLYDLSGGAR